MAEPISGLIVGGIGLASLITLFQTCTAGYQVLVASARDVGKQASFLEAKFEIEYNRLRLWGRYVGLYGGNCHLLRQLPTDTQELITKVLGQIRLIEIEAESLTKKYGIQNEQVPKPTMTKSSGEANLRLFQTGSIQCSAYNQAERQGSIVSGLSRFRKLTWAIEDHEHLKALSDQLQYFNQSLWGSLSVNHGMLLSQGLPSFVLPSVFSIEDLHQFKSVASKTDNSSLQAGIDLKTILLNQQLTRNPLSESVDLFNLQISISSVDFQPVQESRQWATYNGRRVILQWRYVSKDLDPESKELVRQRVYALTVLRAADTPPEWHLPRCIKYFKDEQYHYDTGNERFGLLYQVPFAEEYPMIPLTNLFDSLPQRKDTWRPPSLTERIKLALGISQELLHIHASGWLHKGLKSQSILLFLHKFSTPNQVRSLTNTIDLGFEYSRPDSATEESLENPSPEDELANSYRHPDCQGTLSKPRFQKIHDYYALGILLLEIGYWRRMSYFEVKKKNISSLERRDILISAAQALDCLCGSVYQEVVIRCLEGRFGLAADVEDSQLQEAAWFLIVKELASLNI